MVPIAATLKVATTIHCSLVALIKVYNGTIELDNIHYSHIMVIILFLLLLVLLLILCVALSIIINNNYNFTAKQKIYFKVLCIRFVLLLFFVCLFSSSWMSCLLLLWFLFFESSWMLLQN